MCGIVGVFDITSRQSLGDTVRAMSKALVHRGPDACGIWTDVQNGIALGHQRLAILDLSPTGSQPMVSACGRYAVVFNGEIYNHVAMRRELGERDWRGHSDTETLLAGFSAWGLRNTMLKAAGMFAIAIWDLAERRLHLIRDRMGEKPLYFGWDKGVFLFASELKALRQFPNFAPSVDRNVLAMYFRFGCIPAPFSIYENVFKLEPGCWLTVDRDGVLVCPSDIPSAGLKKPGILIERWWALKDSVLKGKSELIQDPALAVSEFEASLHHVISEQSIADVPLGAFLSGGVDSSLIAAVMQSASRARVRTFTIGFSEGSHNEAEFAKAVAKHLGTQHENVFLEPSHARDVIPDLPDIYDEPFADSSQIPTYLVCQQARRFLTVAISGDGGDELFGGYNRYLWVRKIWSRSAGIPWAVRRVLSKLAGGLSVETLTGLAGFVTGRTAGNQVSLVGDKVHKLADLVGEARYLEDFYPLIVSQWNRPEEVTVTGREYTSLLDTPSDWPAVQEEEDRMMYLDSMMYLPNDVLVKVDRAAMAVSLETRAPLLDHRIVELAGRVPLSMKIRNGQGKWILRQVLYKHVPKDLIERPKMGFSVPLASWLRGPLREWAEALLDETRITREGYLHPQPIQRKWREHLAGRRNWQHHLWSVLMFQAWLEKNRECQ